MTGSIEDEKIKVLLVDDEQEILSQAQIFIERENSFIDIEPFLNTKKALEELSNNSYDCIISDYQMPEVDGLELLREVRENLNIDIPFIMFTGRGREEIAMKALNLGANRYLQKGGDPKSQYGVLADAIVQEYKRWSIERKMKKTLKERAELENKISKIASRYAKDYDFDEITNNTLKDVGQLVGASRSYLFQFRKDEGKMDNTHEWCDEGVSSQIDSLKGLSINQFPWWIEKLENDEIIYIHDVSNIPERGKNEKEILKKQNIKSALVLPVYKNNELSGFIGFDDVEGEKEWKNKSIFSLRIIASVVGNSLEKREAKRKLEKSEKKYRILSEGSSNGIYVYQNEEFKYINEAMTEITGYSCEELKDMNFLDLLHPDHRAKVKKYTEKAMRGDISDLPEHVEVKIFRRDDELVWLQITPTIIEFEGGQAILGNVADISERKKRENELKSTLTRLKTLIKNQEVGILFEDHNRNILYANQRFCDLFGLPEPEVVIGKNCEKAAKKSKEMFKNPREFVKRIDELLNKNNKVKDEELELKDGRTFLRDFIPVYSENEYIGNLWQYQDITKRKKLEKKIRNKKEKFRQIFQNANDAIYLNKLKEDGTIGKFTEVNNVGCEKLGYSKRELLEMTLKNIFPPDKVDELSKLNKELIDKGEVRIESKIQTKNGEEIQMEIQSHIFELENEKRVLSIARDISERKKTEKRQKFLHSLLRHDIRNKMQVIQGYLKLVNDYELPEDVEDILSKADKASQRGKNIIEKVRTLRSVEQKEETEEISLKQVINEVIEDIKPQADEKSISIEYRGDDCIVQGGSLIKELFSNLVENSITHSECDNIRIEVQEADNKCTVIVEDDGKGIPEDIRDDIFEKGFKSGKTGKTGLGLYLVKRIVNTYNGDIQVGESDKGGAQFTVKFQKNKIM